MQTEVAQTEVQTEVAQTEVLKTEAARVFNNKNKYKNLIDW
jgi:hypothetical protein